MILQREILKKSLGIGRNEMIMNEKDFIKEHENN